jgi:hypothetical protein
MPKPGRNDLCTCGSGKKLKRCCGVDGGPRKSNNVILIALAGALAAAIIAAVMASQNNDAGAGRTWSAEHGHFHVP